MLKKKTTNKTLKSTTEIPVLFAIPASTPPNIPLLLLFMRINIDLNNDNIQYLTILNEIENNNKNNFLNYILNLGFNEYIKLKNIHFNKDFNSNNNLDNNNILLNNLDIIIENKTNKLYNLINENNIFSKNSIF